MAYSEEGLALARARIAARDLAPFPVGAATVLRVSHAQVQVVCSSLARHGLPTSQRWIPLEALHPTCTLGKRGQVGELVLTRRAARRLGMVTP